MTQSASTISHNTMLIVHTLNRYTKLKSTHIQSQAYQEHHCHVTSADLVTARPSHSQHLHQDTKHTPNVSCVVGKVFLYHLRCCKVRRAPFERGYFRHKDSSAKVCQLHSASTIKYKHILSCVCVYECVVCACACV